MNTVAVGALARAGHITVAIYALNFRRVTILTGEHAGKSTARPTVGGQPWKIIDRNGLSTMRRPQRPPRPLSPAYK